MRRTVSALAFLFTAICASVGWCQTYPGRPVHLVVPFGAGAPDTIARVVGQQLALQMGQPFVVENRAGANGVIGAARVAKAPADGHTLLVTSASFAVNPSLYRELPFDALKDFAPVTNICTNEALILVVNPALPVQSVRELMALANKPDSRLSYGSPGVGNTLHLATELLNVRAGTKLLHIPYKTMDAAVSALVGGEIQVMFVTPPSTLQFIRAGKLRPLGYTNSTRAAILPDVPTMAEAGIPGMEFNGGWFGLFTPANTPVLIVTKLAAEVRIALSNPQVKERMAAIGLTPVGNSPAEFRQFFESEIKTYAELTRLAGIQPE